MILIGTRAAAAPSRREVPIDGAVFYRSEWMQHGRDTRLAPNVILVEQPPHATLMPHFHQVNQFQLFVEGSGTIGRQAIAPCMIHYAGAYTGYGPLVAGPDGIKYLTLRPGWDSGFIPIAERQRMRRGPRRHAGSEIFTVGQEPDWPAEGTWRQLIAPGPDGLCAACIRLDPDAPLRVAHTAGSQGMFLVVLQGALRASAAELERWDSIYVTADEAPPSLLAGANGARVVAMHVPATAPDYETTPS